MTCLAIHTMEHRPSRAEVLQLLDRSVSLGGGAQSLHGLRVRQEIYHERCRSLLRPRFWRVDNLHLLSVEQAKGGAGDDPVARFQASHDLNG